MSTLNGAQPLTVAIMARLLPPFNGGVEQAVMGTVAALGRLNDGDERYIVVTDPLAPDWLDPYIGPNTRVAVIPEPLLRTLARRCLVPAAMAMPAVHRLARLVT